MLKPAFSAQLEDKIILVRSALKIVLRRDLSLNRRLFRWLLGPSEDPELQMDYLKKHALSVMCEALRVSLEILL
jgi:hypothetical protein